MKNSENTLKLKDMAGIIMRLGDRVTFNSRRGSIAGRIIRFSQARNIFVKDETGWKRTMKPTSVLVSWSDKKVLSSPTNFVVSDMRNIQKRIKTFFNIPPSVGDTVQTIVGFGTPVEGVVESVRKDSVDSYCWIKTKGGRPTTASFSYCKFRYI